MCDTSERTVARASGDGDRTSSPVSSRLRPEAPARVAGLQRQAAALQQLAGEGRHGGRDTAQHRQRHEQPDVERPPGDDTVDAAVERGHHRLRADEGDDPLGLLDVVGGESRRQRRAGARRDDRLATRDGGQQQVAVDLGPDDADVERPPVAEAERVERLQAGVEMRVAPAIPNEKTNGTPCSTAART